VGAAAGHVTRVRRGQGPLVERSRHVVPAQRAAVANFSSSRSKLCARQTTPGTWQGPPGPGVRLSEVASSSESSASKTECGSVSRGARTAPAQVVRRLLRFTLPQLAAAAAHYRTADKNAPRLICMDEAFVGVDKNMRAKCMDLLRVVRPGRRDDKRKRMGLLPHCAGHRDLPARRARRH